MCLGVNGCVCPANLWIALLILQARAKFTKKETMWTPHLNHEYNIKSNRVPGK